MRSLIIAWGLCALASAAAAQAEFRPLWNYQDDDVIHGAERDFWPLAGFDQYPSLRNAWTQTLIYNLEDHSVLDPNGHPAVRFILKRRDGYQNNLDGQVFETVTWADSRTCHQMFWILEQMTHLRAPSVDIGLAPWIPRQPPADPVPPVVVDGLVERVPVGRIALNVPLDGTTVRVWSDRGYSPGNAFGSVSMASGGGDIADWSDYAEEWLEDCWRDEQPPFE